MSKLKRLKRVAEDNVSVTIKEGQVSEDLKTGSHAEIPQKTKAHENRSIVGMSKGITRNLGNFESLRVDCWLSDEVGDEDPKDVARKISEVIDEVIAETLKEVLE